MMEIWNLRKLWFRILALSVTIGFVLCGAFVYVVSYLGVSYQELGFGFILQETLRLVDEFDKFVAMEEESISSVYERLTTVVNVMDRNENFPLPITINNKLLNSLQPEWSKYVTMTRQNANIKETTYDHLFDTLSQYEPHVIPSRAKKAARNHDPLALVDHSNVYPSHSYESPSYSHSSQPYYVTHPLLVVDYEKDYQEDIQGDAQEDKEQMLLVMKDEAGSNLNEEENDFMLENHYGDDSSEELNAAVIIMAHIQPTQNKSDAELTYDADTLGEGKENGVNILKSIDEGPYQIGTVRETLAESTEGAPQFGPERPRVYSDLTPEEKDRYNADIQATNILLQGLPKDIYTLINYYTDAKDIWDNHKRESIHDYYVQFAKLINDMRNIKMTMSRMHLNSKFVNNMLPEWGRFVTVVKLNRGLRDSNYDQQYAYLKQRETHAKENKMMLERMLLEGSELTKEDRGSHLYDDFEHFRQPKGESIHDYYVRFAKLINDMRNIKMTMSQMQLNSKFVNNMLPEWGRFMTVVKLNRGLRDSNYDQLGQGMNPRGGSTAGYGGAQNRVRNVNQAKLGQARPMKCYNCNGTGHIAQENGVALDAEQLLFLAGGQDNAFDADVDEQSIQDLALNVDNVFQADDYDAFDYDMDEASTAQTMFMANLSSVDPITDEAGPS
nr:hypothetical protein [Tanacetum cinerariifolium]